MIEDSGPPPKPREAFVDADPKLTKGQVDKNGPTSQPSSLTQSTNQRADGVKTNTGKKI